MKILLRKFTECDIDKKIEWINNPLNNKYLHYNLPLEKEKTLAWFLNVKDKKDRIDLIIEYDNTPVGIIGLLNINQFSAELYITIGEREYLGKGIAKNAIIQLTEYAFDDLKLTKVILFTEVENKIAQYLFDKIGFIRYSIRKNDVFRDGIYRDRYYYELYNRKFNKTPIYQLDQYPNNLYIKRDDFIPFSFGGNKVRKALYFFDKIKNDYNDYVVTYGTSSSNHCRIIANLAKTNNLPCIIISPSENEKQTFNRRIMKLLNAEVVTVPLSEIKSTINKVMYQLRSQGFNPYFIEGGGHGNIGTKAMIDCYKEIYDYEIYNDIHFDYVFFASGTGTTQAGFVLGKLLYDDKADVIGISIARKSPYGRDIVLNSIDNYLQENNFYVKKEILEQDTIFIDDYIGEKYGSETLEIREIINDAFIKYGVPLDSTYTGKAFYGMMEYLKSHNVENKNVLFIHTGGTPLFFNDLEG